MSSAIARPVRKRALYLGGVCCIALFVFAFVAAPKSCEWGLSAYFWSGVACLVTLFALPFILRDGISMQRRVVRAFALTALGCGTWIAGLFVANVRIMCRLF